MPDLLGGGMDFASGGFTLFVIALLAIDTRVSASTTPTPQASPSSWFSTVLIASVAGFGLLTAVGILAAIYRNYRRKRNLQVAAQRGQLPNVKDYTIGIFRNFPNHDQLVLTPGSTVTYRVNRFPTQDKGGGQKYLSDRDIVKIIDRAFKIWEKHANFTFKRVRSGEDLSIGFFSGAHGDLESFDGRGGRTAHASFPKYGRYIHFDNDEVWTDGESFGENLLKVAVHEIGHTLGLDHSNVPGSVMEAVVLNYVGKLNLSQDDISKIQGIYGTPRREPIPFRPMLSTIHI